jgi:hypothetical protein
MEDTSRRDDWRSLCELASKETNPQRLLELITKINRALEESHRRSRTDEAPVTVDRVLAPIRSTISRSDLDFYGFPEERSVDLQFDC